ncbi:MAG: sigma-54 dependent transcriptional regulator [Burkholderiaceae bacterium]
MASAKFLRRFGYLYGSSPVMEALYRQIQRVSLTDATVLIEGESGTGKELIAQTIHQLSQRANGNFVAINCAAIAPQLIEAALFGHEKGSFTGAFRQHSGYFEHASGGTLFLDEITDMPAEMQVKLLRVLECGRFYRVGGSAEITSNVRLIAATNRSLQEAVNAGSLRQDLMYRLAVFPLRVPPLRERGPDRDLLAQHFLHELNLQAGTNKTFAKNALDRVKNYAWPGNVRELKNRVYRAYILATDALTLDVPAHTGSNKTRLADGTIHFTVGMPLAAAQREMLQATLQHCSGNKELTARILGISLKTLYNKIKER